MNKPYNLPSKYLSYSAAILWEKDKSAYRAHYYEHKAPFSTPYTIYGSQVHKMIEDGKLEVKDHPQPQYTSEVRIYTHIEDVPVLGYIDLLDVRKFRLSDIKTSINPWTQSMVQKLDQLPWYQLLVKNKYSKCSQYAKVIWLETEWLEKKCGIATNKTLVLTGKQETFTRRAHKGERDRIRDMIVRVAGEISEDYTYYNK